MGALEIRRASVGVKPLGSFSMPNLNTGASEAWQAQARAAKAAGDAARVAGMAEVEGLSRRGQIVNQAMRQLAGVAEEMMLRENDRKVDQAVIEKETWRNAFMNGDGTAENVGKFNETIDDADVWLKDVDAANKKKNEEILGRLNAAQREAFVRREQYDNLNWQKRIATHAANTTLKNQIVVAEEMLAVRLNEAAVAYMDKDTESRDMAVTSFYEAFDKSMDAKFVPEAQRPALRRSATFQLISAVERNSIDRWKGEMAGEEDSSAVGKKWDAIIKEVGDGKSLLGNAMVKASIGSEGLADNEIQLMVNRLKSAKQDCMRTADSNLLANQRQQIKMDDDRYAEKIGSQDQEGWKMPDLGEENLRIDMMPSVASSQKLEMKQKWARFVETRKKFEQDQKEKNGYPEIVKEKDSSGNEVERTVWISSRVWPKNTSDPYISDFADSKDKILNDPKNALAVAEAGRATGNISRADYNRIREVAMTADLSPDVNRSLMTAGGGLFGDLLMKKVQQKGGLTVDDLDSLKVYYKKGDASTEGYRGGYSIAVPYRMFPTSYLSAEFIGGNEREKAKLWKDIAQYDGDGKGEYLLSNDEVKLLLNKIGEYAHYGLTGDKLDKALETLFAPAVAKYYNMTMEQRLQDEEFDRIIKAESEIPTMAADKASVMVGRPIKKIVNR